MKIKMNKIVEESVKGFFCHFDNCGRLYLRRHQNDGLSFTIIDKSGDIRVRRGKKCRIGRLSM
ncbi:hypothetical protein A2I97_18025 [Bacillus velezensis]|nr:hypothetical protein A2I97_18025 [Bacillus velezensis]